MRTDAKAAGKELHDAFGRGVGGYIVIGRRAMQENVAHTTAYQQGLVAMLVESFADRIGEFSWSHGLIMRQTSLNEMREFDFSFNGEWI